MREGEGWRAVGLDEVEARPWLDTARHPELRRPLEGDPDLGPLLEG
jgi:hypothetical protein